MTKHNLNEDFFTKDPVKAKTIADMEEATIEQTSHAMDDILAKSDKFETIRVLMEILCKELGIGVESQPKAIFDALNKVSEDYYKAMETFKNLRQAASKNWQK